MRANIGLRLIKARTYEDRAEERESSDLNIIFKVKLHESAASVHV